MNNTKDELIKDAEEYVNRSGFSTELYVHSILSRHIVYANQYFFDYDLSLARSVDLVVSDFDATSAKSKYGDNRAYAEMVIECKKSDSHLWVFFYNKHYIDTRNCGQLADYKKIYTGKDLPCCLWDANESLNLHYGEEHKFREIAVSYSQIKKGSKTPREERSETQNEKGSKTRREKDGKDEIFEAVNQVLKYISYTLDRNIAEWKIENPRDADYWSPVFIYYPVIVFDGLLCIGRLLDGKIKLTETNHVVLKTQFKPRYSDEERTYYIDIVSKEYFREYLGSMEKEVGDLVALVDQNYSEFISEATSLYNKQPSK